MKMRHRAVPALGGLLLLALPLNLAPVTEPLPSPRPASQHFEADAGPDERRPLAAVDPHVRRSRHLTRLGVDHWHRAGLRGAGVKIAVLDSGFRGYRAHLGKALPQRVTVRSFRSDQDLEAKDSQHGILCAEVLHAVAPDAELLFANWDSDQPDSFLSAVRWARQEGAQVITCSIIMPTWSDGEGGGPVHGMLNRLVGTGSSPGDMLFFGSAGNTARRHWTGDFQDDGWGFHLWQRECRDNQVYPWGRDTVTVAMSWPPGRRYRLSVCNAATGREVGSIETRSNREHCCALVRFEPLPGQRYVTRLRLMDGSPSRFHLVALGADLDCATARGSIPFPGDGLAVQAVGAVDENDEREPYSSCGPNSLCLKPDFVAPVPFPSMWRLRPFSGTSAAAPQVAGLAALWWSRHPEWTARQVRNAMQQYARDLGPVGHDWETGHGLAIVPPWDELNRPASVQTSPPEPTPVANAAVGLGG